MNNHIRELYLNLLRDTLAGVTFNDGQALPKPLRLLGRMLGLRLSRPVNNIGSGKYWPAQAKTMVGTCRLDNIRYCLETVESEGIAGDFVECGVWRGGASIYAAGVLETLGSDRKVWLCDSFAGLPAGRLPEDRFDTHCWSNDYLAVSQPEVADNLKRFGLLHRAVFVQGLFSATLPSLSCRRIAVLRADGDMYESTLDILDNLYERVAPGGFVIIDDYGAVPVCRKATDEFFERHRISERIPIDESGVWWRKS